MNALDLSLTRAFFGREHHQVRMAYDSNNMAEYIGFAARGVASSTGGWFITKLTYNSSNMVTLIQSSERNVIWDDRTTLTYA